MIIPTQQDITTFYCSPSVQLVILALDRPHAQSNIVMLLILYRQLYTAGDGVAQLVECWTQDPKDEGLNPVRSTKNICEFF